MTTLHLLIIVLILLEGAAYCDSLPSSYQIAGFFPRSAVLTRSNRMHLKNRRLLESKRAEKRKQEKIYWLRRMETIVSLLSEDELSRKNQAFYVYWKLGKELVLCPFINKEKNFVSEVSGMLKIPEEELREYMAFFSCFEKISPYLNWTAYKDLLKVGNKNERLYYHHAVHFYSWDARKLKEEIQKGAYGQEKIEEHDKVLKSFIVLIDPDEVIEELLKSREPPRSSYLFRYSNKTGGFSGYVNPDEDDTGAPVIYRV